MRNVGNDAVERDLEFARNDLATNEGKVASRPVQRIGERIDSKLIQRWYYPWFRRILFGPTPRLEIRTLAKVDARNRNRTISRAERTLPDDLRVD